MEDISKALLIAAGMFFAILILSALVLFYNQVSSFYNQEHEATVIEQTQKFNAQFENYNRKDIRGSDLISLMNKVIDYNETESYFDGTNYKRIIVNIHIGAENTSAFKFEVSGSKYGTTNRFITADITNATRTGLDWQNDRQLVAITNTSTDLCDQLENLEVSNPTDTQLQQLSSKISSIILGQGGEDQSWAISYRIKRAEIIKDLLGIEVEINSDDGITKNVSRDTINDIKDITSQYYQYTQFKRAYFDCIEMNYDEKTNRVVEMKFELQTKDGEVVFD